MGARTSPYNNKLLLLASLSCLVGKHNLPLYAGLRGMKQAKSMTAWHSIASKVLFMEKQEADNQSLVSLPHFTQQAGPMPGDPTAPMMCME